MKSERELVGDIEKLVLHIQEKYPELYKNLEEDIINIPDASHPEINAASLQGYFDNIQQKLKHYLENS